MEAFRQEGIIDRPLLFLCVEHGAEQIALYLIKKGADIHECHTVRQPKFMSVTR